MIAAAEQPLDHAGADLGRAEQGAEPHRRSVVDAPRLQEDQQVDDHDRADAGGQRQHQGHQHEDQALMGDARFASARHGRGLFGSDARRPGAARTTAICNGSDTASAGPA